jgi:hypothetical protein
LNYDEEREFDAKLLKGKKELNIETVKEQLKIHNIDLDNLSNWRRISKELRYVANVVKHADGTSSEKLKFLNPDLFLRPTFGVHLTIPICKKRVYQPLFGEGLYVTVEVLRLYVHALREFWEELASAIEKQSSIKTNSP